jgi:hypothetical protein
MHLNLSDPDSIVSWWRVYPERHWGYLEFYEKHSPQFQPVIRQARRRIMADPRFDQQRIDALRAREHQALPTVTLDEVWADELHGTANVDASLLN